MTAPATQLMPHQVKQLMDDGSVRLIDVREAEEYAQVHIDGAVLVPLSNFNLTMVDASPDTPLVLHCRSGVRCGMAAEALRATGFGGQIHRMTGGILAWIEAGLPVIRSGQG